MAEHNPIDRIEPLAKAHVPIYHIHGDCDTAVPLEKNSGELAQRYRRVRRNNDSQCCQRAGAQYKARAGFNAGELVDFVIAQANEGSPSKSK